MDAIPETMGPRDFSRLLEKTYGLRMSHQAVSKAPYLPKTGNGRVVVQDALVMLADRGRICLGSQQQRLPLDAPPEDPADKPRDGRPREKGNGYYDELTLTERVKRRKLEMELEEREGKLLRVEDVTEAMVAAARRIGDRIDRLHLLADSITAAAKEGGANAVRDLLRREARTMREQLAETLTLSAADEDREDGPS
ncbi:MAG: hypothetical protein M0006_02360 [Magnetospirillum sp.]|nr:hypothetical protein [Magnetospirillum sp.]